MGDCVLDEAEEGTGFLNSVTPEWDDQTRDDEACGEPQVNLGGREISKTVTGAVAGFTGGDEEVFTIGWVCTTRTGGTLSGSVTLADGETRLVSEEIPLVATCVVTEEDPDDELLTSTHVWLDPTYTAADVTLVVAEPVGHIGVVNEVGGLLPTAEPPRRRSRPRSPKPGLPSSGGEGGSLLAVLGLLTAGLAAGLVWRRRRSN